MTSKKSNAPHDSALSMVILRALGGRTIRMGTAGQDGTAMMREWMIFRARNPTARLACVDLQPTPTVQAINREDIVNFGGFSDRCSRCSRLLRAASCRRRTGPTASSAWTSRWHEHGGECRPGVRDCRSRARRHHYSDGECSGEYITNGSPVRTRSARSRAVAQLGEQLIAARRSLHTLVAVAFPVAETHGECRGEYIGNPFKAAGSNPANSSHHSSP